jgi:hypothetical protein
MARNPPDPKIIAVALDLIAGGASEADIAEHLMVSAATIARWRKMYGGPEHKPRTQLPTLVDDTPAEPLEAAGVAEGDSLAVLRAMRRDLFKGAEQAKQVGNMTAYQRIMRDVANLSPVIAREEKAGREDRDVLRVSKSEIDEAMAAVNARVEQLCARPLLCAECGRKLSVKWADLQPDPTPAPGDQK